MKPTLEEVKKVAIEYSLYDYSPTELEQLQAFYQYAYEAGRKEQREIQAKAEVIGASNFKTLLLESTKSLLHPHIEGVFAVYEERIRAANKGKE